VLGFFVAGVTNWSGEGVEPKYMSKCSVRRLTLLMVASSPFYRRKGRGKKGNEIRVTVPGRWDVLSRVTVR
jgi:hypothetical protein